MILQRKLQEMEFSPFAQKLILQLRPKIWPHHLESGAVAFAIFMLLSIAIFGFRVDSALHEWGLFLKHIESASDQAKAPVFTVIFVVYAVILAIVVYARRKNSGANNV